MADFFNQLGAAVRKMTADVSAEISIAAKEQKLRERYQALGRMYYRAVKEDQIPVTEELAEEVNQISALQQEISRMKYNQRAVHESDFED